MMLSTVLIIAVNVLALLICHQADGQSDTLLLALPIH